MSVEELISGIRDKRFSVKLRMEKKKLEYLAGVIASKTFSMDYIKKIFNIK